MPKYTFSRKISPKRWFSELNFESAEFTIEGCDSAAEAMQEIDNWIGEWVRLTKLKITAIKTEKDEEAEALERKLQTEELPF